jgi:hypothetical protein
MKRRGLRVALTTGAIGLAPIAGLVAFNWGVVRDHAEAWWFQTTSEARTFQPTDKPSPLLQPEFQLMCLAIHTGCAVVGDPACFPKSPSHNTWRYIVQHAREVDGTVRLDGIMPGPDTASGMLQALRSDGYHIVEQRFPRRAYVVVGYTAP